MSRVSVIGYRFVSDGAFSEKQRELILADPRVREVRPGPGWRRSLDDINIMEVMNVMTELEIRDVIRSKVEGATSYIDISTLSTHYLHYLQVDQVAGGPGPVRIIFSDSVCLDCGEEGDVRLMGESGTTYYLYIYIYRVIQ